MNELLKNIAENKTKLSDLLKNKDNRDVLYNWLKTELTYTSNAIEGNTLTRRETTLAIEENITSGSKPISHYVEAVNHAKAFELIMDLAKKKHTIDNNDVLQIHSCILSGIDNANAGCFRKVPVRISGSRTVLPNPLKVPDLMEQFNHWLKTTDEEIILKAINAHYRLVTIHPFKDGNGRTARLLMNLMLMQSG
ncbi:MAG: Fic family protein, partial [Alphaproteobacteria bacterium]|nr:Fic family protein [Alphaproteobacteria bacterium]